MRSSLSCINIGVRIELTFFFYVQQAFVHVSTTYCNTEKHTIPEKLVEPYFNWRDIIAAAEKCSNEDLQGFSYK